MTSCDCPGRRAAATPNAGYIHGLQAALDAAPSVPTCLPPSPHRQPAGLSTTCPPAVPSNDDTCNLQPHTSLGLWARSLVIRCSPLLANSTERGCLPSPWLGRPLLQRPIGCSGTWQQLGQCPADQHLIIERPCCTATCRGRQTQQEGQHRSSGTMAEHLPQTDQEVVSQAQAEYDSLFQTGSAEEVDSARYRCVLLCAARQTVAARQPRRGACTATA